MKNYDPSNIAQWNGRRFVLQSGTIYTVAEGKIFGPEIPQDQHQLAIGGMSPEFKGEFPQRIVETSRNIARHIDRIVELYGKGLTEEVAELIRHPQGEGLYEKLDFLTVGSHFTAILARREPTADIHISCRSSPIASIETI
ncbi:MAG: hypothetical protein ACP5NS_03940 [Candidatus Pacearchaeota archaeon]